MFKYLAIAVTAIISTAAFGQTTPPVFKLCTGGESGNYFKAGMSIKKQVDGQLQLNVLTTKGSMENLRRTSLDPSDSQSCDAAIVQPDSLLMFETEYPGLIQNIEASIPLYQEYAHLICNGKSGISSITNLTPKNIVYTGANGSGTQITWAGFVKSNKDKYGVIQTLPNTIDNRTLGKIQQDENACALFIAGLNAPVMKTVNEAAKTQEGSLKLVPIYDSYFKNNKNPKTKISIYEQTEIPSGTYSGGLQPSSFWGSEITTIRMPATIILNVKTAENNGIAVDYFLGGVRRALPKILKDTSVQD